MARVDRKSIDNMSIEALRNELVWQYERQLALMEAFEKLPEIAPVEALHFLNDLSFSPNDHARGKALQRTATVEKIPPNFECETGAGLWVVLRAALIDDRKAKNQME